MNTKNTLHFQRILTVLTVVVLSLDLFYGILPGQDPQAKKDQWRESLIQHRLQKDREFKTSSTSPMAAVKRLTVKPSPGQKTFVIDSGGSISLSPQKAPGALFSLSNSRGQWQWEAHAPGITCTTADKPLAPGSPINQSAQFQGGDRWTMVAYPSEDRLVLLVFDVQCPGLKHFSRLLYYPPDPKYAVPAVLEKFPEAAKTTMLTSRNLEKTFYRWATLRFQLEGQNLRLTAFKYSLQGEESNILFIPFGDKTNGKATYASGRFLEIPEPAGPNFILDFNYCFNPLCNYAHEAYNCPLPPLENILEVSINAGEKTYPH